MISEITSEKLIIALNKVDLIPEGERDAKVAEIQDGLRKAFYGTKFADAPIIPTAAAVGGEKVAAVKNKKGSSHGSSLSSMTLSSKGVDMLVEKVKDFVDIPSRNVTAPFYYAIDHCFAIKGHGTVITGTVLSGTVSVNSMIEFPDLQVQRKGKII